MKHFKDAYLFLTTLALVYLTFTSFKSGSESKKVDHLFIYSEHHDLDNVYISIGGKEYRKLHFKSQREGDYNMNPIINLIHEYEGDGWELISGDMLPQSQFFRLQRKAE